jgi:SAM-dependent methyltransferase
MKKEFINSIRVCLNCLNFFGLNPRLLLNNICGLPFYFQDLLTLVRQKGKDTTFSFGCIRPILNERQSESGIASGHYFHQDLLIARKIFKANPKRHVDIGSRIDGFVAHVAVFREIEVFDIRAQLCKVKNIIFKKADLMRLPENLLNSCDSVSALHSIEHFGLGRYGDPVDYNGSRKAIENIHRMLKVGGKLYFSVPIGKQRIEFNAQRVFSVQYLLHLFEDKFFVNSFSYVDDKGQLFEDAELVKTEIEKNFNCNYGCGIFELTKF